MSWQTDSLMEVEEQVSQAQEGSRSSQKLDAARLFTTLLFVLFIGMLLMSFFMGTSVYQKLFNQSESADDQRLSITLFMNDLRANDQIDSVARAIVLPDGKVELLVAEDGELPPLVEATAEGDNPYGIQGAALVLRETLDSGVYETRLYRKDGMIMKEYALATAPFDPEKASQIVASSVFDFTYDHGLLTITTDAGVAQAAMRTQGGGA